MLAARRRIVLPSVPLATLQVLPASLLKSARQALLGYKGLVGGSLGELEHSILIEQYAGKDRAAEVAPHWRGSSFALVENKKEDRVVLLYASDWDSEAAARNSLGHRLQHDHDTGKPHRDAFYIP